jgi:preprotein translocase subunit SecG
VVRGEWSQADAAISGLLSIHLLTTHLSPLTKIMWSFLLGLLLFLTAAFLILIILLQRGRGGGLAGALGGMGGQSAFGAKAGDLFTRITMGVAAFWILLCIATPKIMGTQETGFSSGSEAGATAPAKAGTSATTGSATSATPKSSSEKPGTSITPPAGKSSGTAPSGGATTASGATPPPAPAGK